jgi:hypothetical protein
MLKETRTTYTLNQPNGESVKLYLEGDYLVIQNIWANDEIQTEVNIHASRATLRDLLTVLDEIETAVIGE